MSDSDNKQTNEDAVEEGSVRIIKKYPNRRVYDTQTSQYIKVDDIRQMVVEGIDFQVIDTQSKTDVTRSVLLQIIFDQESEKNPLFSSENLRNFIRYNNLNNDAFSAYMNQSLLFFSKEQKEITDHFYNQLASNPVDAFTEATQKNMQFWQGMQQQFFDSFNPSKQAQDEEDK